MSNYFKAKKMKNSISVILLLLTFLCGSCDDYLGFDDRGEVDEDMVFEGHYSKRNFLYRIYESLPLINNYVDGAMLACATDDAEYVNEFSSIQRFNTGNITVSYNPDDQWSNLYTGIRKCNTFLENATVDRLDEYKYNLDKEKDGEEYYPTMLLALEFERAETRFLRAFFYFELIKRYGGVPLLTETTQIDIESETFDISRNSFEECHRFILNELNMVIPTLPRIHNNQDGLQGETGRATKGAAMALKARLLLYSASPLFNSEKDVDLWKSAARAAQDVIETNYYTLESNFANLFTKYNSRELIFERREGNSNTFEKANYPIGYDGGNTGTCPSQNLVDAFEMQATGLPITDIASGYNPSMPYTGRDPRLDASVIYNNSDWDGRNVEIWMGGLDGPQVLNSSKTGYYIKKYLNPAVEIGSGQEIVQRHTWYYFRLGEMYLNLAEAMNEAYGPDSDPDGIGMTATDAVNQIRTRVSMPNFPQGLSQDEFRIKLQNERRVELAFENHRFWDVRRWQIGSQTIGEDLRGMKIEKMDDNSFKYTPIVIESRKFQEKMNLYPIPYSEVVKANIKQNPGW